MPRLDSVLTLLVAIGLLLASVAGMADDKAASRDALRQMRKETLEQLYKENRQARNQIRSAAGFGVFEVAGVHILFVGGSGGRGVVKDNLTGRDTYMNMGAVAGGLGVGFQDTRTVLIFKKRKVLKDFLEQGWTFGGDARAIAQVEGKGGSVGELETPEGIIVYQLTKAGLSVKATVQGTKFWRDPDLNTK
ncbi:MAG TPA: YSC84-related protein [Chromatiaceae bacterium]|nr:YSC84-related protein [Chromatiaceae bacterium]